MFQYLYRESEGSSQRIACLHQAAKVVAKHVDLEGVFGICFQRRHVSANPPTLVSLGRCGTLCGAASLVGRRRSNVWILETRPEPRNYLGFQSYNYKLSSAKADTAQNTFSTFCVYERLMFGTPNYEQPLSRSGTSLARYRDKRIAK